MKIKSYFANTIAEAIKTASGELGPDAMIIASHRSSADKERLGLYEVVFGLAESGTGAEAAAPPAPEGLERLRDRMEGLRKSVSKKREVASAARIPLVAPKIAASLVKGGFPEEIAEDLARKIQVRSRDDKQSAAEALGAALAERIRFSPKLNPGGAGRSMVALVGPPGVGKTSMIVKLAVRYGLSLGRPTRLISTDTYRLGGSDMLVRYARAMDLKIDLPQTTQALEQSLELDKRNELVLIDTAGYSRAQSTANPSLAAFVAKRAGVDVHLVLPAYASATDLAAMMARFQPFLASKLLFTGVDMCESVASALSLALTVEMPLSFLGVGDRVPEDLEEAASDRLAARLLPALMEAAAAAA